MKKVTGDRLQVTAREGTIRLGSTSDGFSFGTIELRNAALGSTLTVLDERGDKVSFYKIDVNRYCWRNLDTNDYKSSYQLSHYPIYLLLEPVSLDDCERMLKSREAV